MKWGKTVKSSSSPDIDSKDPVVLACFQSILDPRIQEFDLSLTPAVAGDQLLQISCISAKDARLGTPLPHPILNVLPLRMAGALPLLL